MHVASPIFHRPATGVPDLAVNSNLYPRVPERPILVVVKTHPRGIHQPGLKPEFLQNDR